MTLACEPSPASSVSVNTLPLPEPKPTVTQSRCPSRATSARWEPKIQDFSFMSWAPTKRSLAFWPTRSSTTEVSSVSASVEPERFCSQTSASAPSSSTISTRRCSATFSASEIAVSTIGTSTLTLRGT